MGGNILKFVFIDIYNDQELSFTTCYPNEAAY